MEIVKIVTFVPETHAHIVREAIGNADGGRIGNYTHCTFSVKGVGRFKPGEGAHLAVGAIGRLESVQEEKIEFVCERMLAKKVME
ncbi:MAG TPA: Nif3-like dinuclear metal center hexameric protein, partial [Methylomirabilota bacterium]|nr:Nif3-like dinuclear metal center hexameric protein [Methylomirabilota bacterium]